MNVPELRNDLVRGTVVPFIGAGVSMSVAKLPSWKQLLMNGAAYALQRGLADAAAVSAIEDHVTATHFGDAANVLKVALGAPRGAYPRWLQDTFMVDGSRVRADPLMAAIDDLSCPVVVTTNYDKLLEITGLDSPQPVTWRDPMLMQKALRDVATDTGHVIHLHGVYDRPDTIVFGSDDYKAIQANSVYRDVVKALWLQHTLLYIGSSFDGIFDPDFEGLFRWAREEFGPTPVEHYVLVRAGDLSDRERGDYLRNWRLRAVEYGPKYSDLEGWLRDANPRGEEARRRRLTIVAQIVGGDRPGTAVDAAAAMSGLSHGTEVDHARLQKDMEQIFQARARATGLIRADIAALQHAARTLVDRSDLVWVKTIWLRVQESSWETVREDERSRFLNVIFSAWAAYRLFTPSMIDSLRRRGVAVHENVVSGSVWSEYSAALDFGLLDDTDNYRIEQLNRLAQSVRALIDADVSTLFPEPRRGTVITAAGSYLAVLRADRVDLRPVSEPTRLAASMPLDIQPYFAEFISYQGRSVIAISDSESIGFWDPRADTYVRRDVFGEGVGVTAHRLIGGVVHSYAAIGRGFVHFRDLDDAVKIRKPFRYYADSLALLDSGRAYVTEGYAPGAIWSVEDSGANVWLSEEKLREIALLLPGLPGRRSDSRDPLSGVMTGRNPVQWLHIEAARFQDRSVVAAKFIFRLSDHHSDSIVMLLDPQLPFPHIVASFVRPDDYFAAFTLIDAPERPTFAVALDTQAPGSSVTWMRAVPSRIGATFVAEGTGVSVDSKIHAMVSLDGRMLAGASLRAVHAFDRETRESFILEENADDVIPRLATGRLE